MRNKKMKIKEALVNLVLLNNKVGIRILPKKNKQNI